MQSIHPLSKLSCWLSRHRRMQMLSFIQHLMLAVITNQLVRHLNHYKQIQIDINSSKCKSNPQWLVSKLYWVLPGIQMLHGNHCSSPEDGHELRFLTVPIFPHPIKLLNQAPISQRVYELIIQISHFYLQNDDPIKSKFCTCHDSSVVITRANLWPNWITGSGHFHNTFFLSMIAKSSSVFCKTDPLSIYSMDKAINHTEVTARTLCQQDITQDK